VHGKSTSWRGVDGQSVDNAGVFGLSQKVVGIWAETQTNAHPALLAKGVRVAARFEGDIQVTGDVQLVNADCVLVGEEPRIGEVRGEMQERLAAALGLDAGRVTVRATTTDGLGFAGRGEGLAAHAVALLTRT
jgi:2-C-methyl-D-erythritol 2,4-cyclodiphosphate synthase